MRPPILLAAALTVAGPVGPVGPGTAVLCAQRAPRAGPAPADRAVYLDSEGVVRWGDGRQEVTLLGANYVLPTASDYRGAG